MRLVLAADLREGSATRDYALATYAALTSLTENKVAFLRIGDQLELLKQLSYPSVEIGEIRDSIVIAFREIRAYMLLDRSNTLVYLANHDVIESYMTFMMSRVDRIIATNYRAAYRLCSSMHQLNVSVPVYRIEPFVDQGPASKRADKIRVLFRGDPQPLLQIPLHPECEYAIWGSANVSGWKTVESPIISEYDIFICLTNEDMMVRSAMMAGVTPIVRNIVPFPEFVLHGTNGFLINKPSEMLEILKKLMDRNELESMRLMTMRSSAYKMSGPAWAKMLIATVNGIGAENINTLELIANQSTYKSWIIPKKTLENGAIISIPRDYNRSKYRVIELESLSQILTYFTSQRFMEVYVFDWDFEEYNQENYDKIMNMARALGKRGMNIFWCAPIKIPQEWSEVFKHMTVLKPEEGLKRVRVV